MHSRKTRRIAEKFHVIIQPYRSLQSSTDDEGKQPKEETFPFHLAYVCISLLRNVFYVTVNKWVVAKSILTSRQLMCKLKFTIIGAHIGFLSLLLLLQMLSFSINNLLMSLNGMGNTLNNDFCLDECGKLLPYAINFLLYSQINEPKIVLKESTSHKSY